MAGRFVFQDAFDVYLRRSVFKLANSGLSYCASREIGQDFKAKPIP